MNKKYIIFSIFLIAIIAAGLWRFVRPMNIFTVTDAFARPISTAIVPKPLKTLRAKECGNCHKRIYDEWRTTIHSKAWTDQYFQVDWKYDGSQQICKNCHIPLDRQQKDLVVGFRDAERWNPILKPNPKFDPKLQSEGVTCTACHLRDGKILAVRDSGNAPHPIKKIRSGNEVCVQCHVVNGNRWDTFFRFPPCGTVAEIQSGSDSNRMRTGDTVVRDVASLGCVNCHMPLVKRPVVKGGKVRQVRRHIWRGGHDPAQVKKALAIRFEKSSSDSNRFQLRITNVGSAHYVPTGTPDRHFALIFRLLDKKGTVIKSQKKVLKRTIMWRPFILDLWDTRLPPGKPQMYGFRYSGREAMRAVSVEAVVRYGLVEKERLERIGYKGREKLSYEVFRKRIPLN